MSGGEIGVRVERVSADLSIRMQTFGGGLAVAVRFGGLRSRRAALGLLTFGAMLWGSTALLLAGGAGAKADAPTTFYAEDLLLRVTGEDGAEYFVSISMLVAGEPGDTAVFAEARDAMLARFPGATVVEDSVAEHMLGQLQQEVHEYVTNNYWWADGTATWRYNASGGPGVTGEVGAIAGGADAWGASGANFFFSYGGASGGDSGACGPSSTGLDGHNTVVWAPLDGATLGVACTWFGTSGSPRPLVEFDMELDPDWDWTTSTSGVQTDLQSVATHEFGHALGLGHSSNQAAVMYAAYQAGSLKRSLHSDDVNGVLAIYGGSAPEATATPRKTATPTRTPRPGGPPTLALKPGANLLTWPGQSESASVALAGQAPISIVYEWDAVANQWKRYAPDVPPWVSNLTTLKQGHAYWFLSNSAGLIAYE
jgi:hypothetical protein